MGLRIIEDFCSQSMVDRGFDFVNVVRTDAAFSTKFLRKNIENHVSHGKFNSDKIKETVHDAYAVWGNSMVSALHKGAHTLTPSVGIGDPVKYHIHDAKQLSSLVLEQAHNIERATGVKPMLVSLDDIITSLEEELEEIAFSRLFSLDGKQQYDYVARPGYKSISKQFKKLMEKIESKKKYEKIERVPLILLEDNVRHAKMLNWLFNQMENNGVYDNADVAAIVSCFCCADEDEKNKIISNGEIVPVHSVVSYNGAKIDVVTPRDLMFDGFVVEVDGENTRLPGIFMDVRRLFKIEAEYEQQFRTDVLNANIAFCETVEVSLNIKDIPLEWFSTSKAISHVTGKLQSTPMKHIMSDMLPTSENTNKNIQHLTV